MITADEARAAKETLSEVATPAEQLGHVSFLSTRGSVSGAMITVDSIDTWYPLSELTLTREARRVVSRYV
jgi:hypothetical protein